MPVTIANAPTIAGTAAQIVYEYEDWGPEHVQDMYDTFDEPGFAPNILLAACEKVAKLKSKGAEYADAEAIVAEELKEALGKPVSQEFEISVLNAASAARTANLYGVAIKRIVGSPVAHTYRVQGPEVSVRRFRKRYEYGAW